MPLAAADGLQAPSPTSYVQPEALLLVDYDNSNVGEVTPCLGSTLATKCILYNSHSPSSAKIAMLANSCNMLPAAAKM